MKCLKALFLFLLISAAGVAQQPAATVPQFDFYRLDNSVFTNKDLAAGKVLLFIFFDATCSHCLHAIQQYNARAGELENTAVYILSLDRKETIINFLNTNGRNLIARKNVTVLQDMKGEFITRFKPRKYPAMFLFSPQKSLEMYSDDEKNVGQFLKKINALRKLK